MKLNPSLLALCLALLSAPIAAAPAGQRPPAAAEAAVEELLAADRAFAAASTGTDAVSGLSAMFDEEVVMPLPTGRFAKSKSEAVAALRANPLNVTARAEWRPVRGGISADGRHGFTVGYMTISDAGKEEKRLASYLAYWVKRPQGWRVAVYKRAPRAAGEPSTAMMPPALPSRFVPVRGTAVQDHRISLAAAEKAFSDEAQKIGLGPAFRKYGSADAVNLGGGSAILVGADAIGSAVAPPDSVGSPVEWSADDALVASSGDLGVTWGMIRRKPPVPEGQPAAIPFFTIWRRASPADPWRYVAE